MAKQRNTVELDDETIRHLAGLGNPIGALTRLGASADVAARHPNRPERSRTDESLRVERGKAAEYAEVLAADREATDRSLEGERAIADAMIVDQREANERMVSATIEAQELTDEAETAKEHAETREREVREVAEFREMFIGILGHDLRNPLGSITVSAASLLRRGQLAGRDAEAAERIIRNSQRMTRMITQLLDLTRARLGGGLPIEPKLTDLHEVCRRVAEEFEASVLLGIEGEVTGNWDEDRLAEVLSNVVGNAIDHAAPETAVVIKARADGVEAVVEISNQGDPIPADMLPNLFEPFRRAPRSRNAANGHLGLGLYIAYQIVLSHGGTLEAHSADGTTTFVMHLPRWTLGTPVRSEGP